MNNHHLNLRNISLTILIIVLSIIAFVLTVNEFNVWGKLFATIPYLLALAASLYFLISREFFTEH